MKGAKLAERLLVRPEGATMDEIIAVTGGPQYNVLRRLEAKGYVVRRSKEGRATRYHVIPPVQGIIKLAVTSKGQVTLPKALRERLGLASGGVVDAAVEGDKLVLSAKRGSIEDLFGLLHRPEMRPRSLEEIEEGIAIGASGRVRPPRSKT